MDNGNDKFLFITLRVDAHPYNVMRGCVFKILRLKVRHNSFADTATLWFGCVPNLQFSRCLRTSHYLSMQHNYNTLLKIDTLQV